MLTNNRRSRKPSRKKTSKRVNVRRIGQKSTSRLEMTAQAARFTVQRRSCARPLTRTTVKRRPKPKKSQQRRSQTRLQVSKKAAPRLKVDVLAPVRDSLRAHGRLSFNVLVLGLLGWGLVWFFASDQFYVQQVVVTGNQRVSAEAILAVSGIQEYSIFWISPRKVISSIIESLPPIKHVRVRYGLPNLVTLIVQEQGEQVMWLVMGRRYWVDDDGYLHLAQGGDEPELLVKDIRPGLPDRVDTRALLAAQQITYLLPELQVVEYAPITGLRFAHPRGWVVYLGTGDDMARKVNVLRALEVELTKEGTEQPVLVDLRFPESPYYRYASDQGQGM
jgi:cell division septal protein FtsQ